MEYNIKESRHQLVSKDNRLIQNGYFSFSEIEWKAVQFIVSKVQPGDDINKTYTISCAEFKALLNWDQTASVYKIKIMLQRIADKSWWYDNVEKHKEELVRWFDIVDIDKSDSATDFVYIKFHSRMEPFLMQLQEKLESENRYFTSYELQNVTLMKHKYSARIYELLRSYQYNNKKWTFENGTGTKYDFQLKILKTKMSNSNKPVFDVPVRWKNWNKFKKDVLDPAVKDINTYTDIKVAYIGKKEDMSHKKTRSISSIEFYMIGKTELEKLQTETVIDKEYSRIEDEKNYHQMTFDDFFNLHEMAMREDEEHKKCESSEYFLIRDTIGFDTMSEEQISFLYRLVLDCYNIMSFEKNKRELFICDLITYYVDLCKATPEDTKTHIFYRVKNMIIDDKDNRAAILFRRYGEQ